VVNCRCDCANRQIAFAAIAPNGSNLTLSDSGRQRPFLIPQRLRYVPAPIDEWVPLLHSNAIKPCQIKTAKLLGRQIVIYRGHDGMLGVLEDRCPHRGVNLSLGKVNGSWLQCSYHGWSLDKKGRVCNAPGLGALDLQARNYAAREACGLVWVFLGDPAASEMIPLPEVAPYATSQSIDVLLSADVKTHWSFALDNGLDLFHDHLHTGMPLFFKIRALEHCGPNADAFNVRYEATLRTIFNRPRPGHIDLQVKRNMVRLDFDGLPVIHACSTPRSANGAEITLWWLISFPSRLGLRLSRKLWTPFVSRAMMRAFHQDTEVLESEQAAFDCAPRGQCEVNPVIAAVHDHMETLLVRYTERALNRGLGISEISAETMASLVRRRELAVLGRQEGKLRLLEPQQVIDLLASQRTGPGLQYQHVGVMNTM
jgi:phenylpropionate dioxygenase-like ring-hydroxylating dioxygenase large terminal subunit